MPIFLAYFASIYIGTSIIYLLFKHKMGRPFYASLTKEQIKIKNMSRNKRRNLFLIGFAITCLLLLIFKPFKKCRKLAKV